MSELIRRIQAATPARVFQGGPSGGDRTAAYLQLRADHAAARDAVLAPMDLDGMDLFEWPTEAESIEEHLLRPDRGRRLSAAARDALAALPTGADLQVVVGDGLSSAAVHAQVPALLPLLHEGAAALDWRCGTPFAIRHARVGVLNDIGDVLAPRIVVLLVGERPGLTTAESLSAYLAFRPAPGQTDGDRNLISNIHAGGTPPAAAAPRILRLAQAMVAAGRGGHTVKEPAAQLAP